MKPPYLVLLIVLGGLLLASAVGHTQENQTPVANAGDDRTVTTGDSVTLNGSASYDPDGDALYYFWSQVDGPDVSLADVSSANPSFVADEAGDYEFRLTVSDGLAGSAPDQVRIRAQNPGDDDDDSNDDDTADDYEPENDDEAGCGF